MNSDNLSAGDWFFGKVLHMGANWQTTASGLGATFALVLTMLAALPYEIPDLGNMFSPKVKAAIVTIGLTATMILKVWNSFSQKSKNVTGGNTQQTLNGDLAKPGSQTLVDATKAAPASN